MTDVDTPILQFYHLILNFEIETIFEYITQLTPAGSPNSDNKRPLSHIQIINDLSEYLTFPDDAPIVIGWLSYANFFLEPQIILTCRMPSDTPSSIAGHTDLLLSGESSMPKI